MLGSSQLMVHEYSSPKLIQYLEHAARAGLPLMITVSTCQLLHNYYVATSLNLFSLFRACKNS